MTELELKEYVEDLTRNNTCHRPDISCYDVCDDCCLLYTSDAADE